MHQRLFPSGIALSLVCCSGGSLSPADAGGGSTPDASTSDASIGDGGPGQSCADPMHTFDVADGSGTCPTAIDTYCGTSGAFCPARAAWCADGGISTPIPPIARTCGAYAIVAESMPPDGEDFFYYDGAGKLLAIARFIQDPARCMGARKYVCVAGGSDFAPFDTMTCASTATTGKACP